MTALAGAMLLALTGAARGAPPVAWLLTCEGLVEILRDGKAEHVDCGRAQGKSASTSVIGKPLVRGDEVKLINRGAQAQIRTAEGGTISLPSGGQTTWIARRPRDLEPLMAIAWSEITALFLDPFPSGADEKGDLSFAVPVVLLEPASPPRGCARTFRWELFSEVTWKVLTVEEGKGPFVRAQGQGATAELRLPPEQPCPAEVQIWLREGTSWSGWAVRDVPAWSARRRSRWLARVDQLPPLQRALVLATRGEWALAQQAATEASPELPPVADSALVGAVSGMRLIVSGAGEPP